MKFVTQIGWGKWDSWGLGINFCHYDQAITVEFIHWYFYISVWRDKDE